MAQDPKNSDPATEGRDEATAEEGAAPEAEEQTREALAASEVAARALADAEDRMAAAAAAMGEPDASVEGEDMLESPEPPEPSGPHDSQTGGSGGSGGGSGGHHAHALPSDENAVDLALGALCQSYSHALSLAFHDAVGERQRRTALIDAAVARAVEEIASSKPKEFEERIKDLKAGLDVLNAPNGADMAAYAGITREFQQAAESLMKLRDQLRA